MMRDDIQKQIVRRGAKTFYVYTHARPDGSIFYVGKGVGRRASDFRKRNEAHRKITGEHGYGGIIVRAYPVVDERHAYAAERRLILALRKAGFSLVNANNGGAGALNVVIKPEHREKLSRALMGHPVSEETKAKMRAVRIGRKLTATHRANLGARDLSKQIEAMRAANTGKKRPPEVGAKITAALQGRKLSPEHRAKIGDSKRGIKWSPEIVAKRAAGIKAAWARRKAQAVGAEA